MTDTGAGDCTEGSTQLVHGATIREGTVEICVEGFWAAICDNSWDSRDVQVICHQLGFTILGNDFTVNIQNNSHTRFHVL